MVSFSTLKKELFAAYLGQIGSLSAKFSALNDADISTENFSFYTSVSSVFSSKIEGEEIELDSYIKHKNFGIEFQPDYTKKIDDLYEAYMFAQKNRLSGEHLFEAHKILTTNILTERNRGVLRNTNMFVLTDKGQIEYVACPPSEAEPETERFFLELEDLLNQNLSTEETFFYAALLHLSFVKIHPMNDGNGRLARLLEKWFLAEKLGPKAWFLQSEKYYYQYHQQYYQNLRKLGLEYDELNWKNALDFLLMLPESLKI